MSFFHFNQSKIVSRLVNFLILCKDCKSNEPADLRDNLSLSFIWTVFFGFSNAKQIYYPTSSFEFVLTLLEPVKPMHHQLAHVPWTVRFFKSFTMRLYLSRLDGIILENIWYKQDTLKKMVNGQDKHTLQTVIQLLICCLQNKYDLDTFVVAKLGRLVNQRQIISIRKCHGQVKTTARLYHHTNSLLAIFLDLLKIISILS